MRQLVPPQSVSSVSASGHNAVGFAGPSAAWLRAVMASAHLVCARELGLGLAVRLSQSARARALALELVVSERKVTFEFELEVFLRVDALFEPLELLVHRLSHHRRERKRKRRVARCCAGQFTKLIAKLANFSIPDLCAQRYRAPGPAARKSQRPMQNTDETARQTKSKTGNRPPSGERPWGSAKLCTITAPGPAACKSPLAMAPAAHVSCG